MGGGSTMHQQQSNKQVVTRLITEVINTGNVTLLKELVSPMYLADHDKGRGADSIVAMATHVLSVRAIYDLHVQIERQVSKDEWVATQVLARGIHSREWMGVPPSGRLLEFTGVFLHRVVDGRIVAQRGKAQMLDPFLEAWRPLPATS